MNYIKPRSLTFWAGVFMILEGLSVGTLQLHGRVALFNRLKAAI